MTFIKNKTPLLSPNLSAIIVYQTTVVYSDDQAFCLDRISPNLLAVSFLSDDKACCLPDKKRQFFRQIFRRSSSFHPMTSDNMRANKKPILSPNLSAIIVVFIRQHPTTFDDIRQQASEEKANYFAKSAVGDHRRFHPTTSDDIRRQSTVPIISPNLLSAIIVVFIGRHPTTFDDNQPLPKNFAKSAIGDHRRFHPTTFDDIRRQATTIF